MADALTTRPTRRSSLKQTDSKCRVSERWRDRGGCRERRRGRDCHREGKRGEGRGREWGREREERDRERNRMRG